MKKILVILVATLVAVGGLSAQAGYQAQSKNGTAAGSYSDTKVFAIDLGTGFSYDLGAKTANATQTVEAVFGLGDNVQAGFDILKGDTPAHSFTLVKVTVFPISDVSVNLLFGGDNAANAITSGFGIGYNLFRTTGALSTVLQANVQYLFSGSSVSSGNLGLGLDLKVGV